MIFITLEICNVEDGEKGGGDFLFKNWIWENSRIIYYENMMYSILYFLGKDGMYLRVWIIKIGIIQYGPLMTSDSLLTYSLMLFVYLTFLNFFTKFLLCAKLEWPKYFPCFWSSHNPSVSAASPFSRICT